MKTLAILLLSSVAALAQPVLPSAFWAPASASVPTATMNPTNIPNFPAATWYAVGTSYVTNAGVATLTDLSGNGWHLTNAAANSTWPKRLVAALNSIDGVTNVSSTSYIRNDGYTNAQPHEAVLVCYLQNIIATSSMIENSTGGGSSEQRCDNSSAKMRLYGGTGNVNMADVPTNKWIVLDIIWLGASSTCYTNGVQTATGNPGTTAINGLTVFNGISRTVGMQGAYVEMATYTNKIPGTNTIGRSNLFYYFTNKYNIVP